MNRDELRKLGVFLFFRYVLDFWDMGYGIWDFFDIRKLGFKK